MTARSLLAVRLALERIVIRGLRNIDRIAMDPAPRINVISGNNGQGKTSILEGVYLLSTSKSFRTPRLTEVVRHGQTTASVRGTFAERWPDITVRREQSVGLENGRRLCRLDGQAPSSLSSYATRSPVVVFDPLQMTLSTGPASVRRMLLDRVTMYTHPAAAAHRARYARALRERNRSLLDRGLRADDSSELDAFEALLAEHGCAMTQARREATERLTSSLRAAFGAIAAPGLDIGARYARAGSEDQEEARRVLRDNRRLDARRKRTSFGPHHDDLVLTIDGHSVRTVASQGQHRAVTLAVKMAELQCIADTRGALPILLLDDVSSELDAARTTALFDHLSKTESQIFLTTTRRDLIVTTGSDAESRRDFEVKNGALVPV